MSSPLQVKKVYTDSVTVVLRMDHDDVDVVMVAVAAVDTNNSQLSRLVGLVVREDKIALLVDPTEMADDRLRMLSDKELEKLCKKHLGDIRYDLDNVCIQSLRNA